MEWNGGHYKKRKGERRGIEREVEEEDLISKDNGISEFISDGTWITRTHGLLHNNFTIVQEKVKRQEKEDYFCKLKRILFNIFVNQLFMMH